MTTNPDFTIEKRILRFSSRVLSTVRGTPKTNICFMHVPKCGGNSIILSLFKTYPLYDRVKWIEVTETRHAASVMQTGKLDEAMFHDDLENCAKTYDVRRTLLHVAMHSKSKVIGGHFLFDEAAYEYHKDSYDWITVLREPISRTISHYGEEVRSGFTSLDFESYLDTEMAHNHATMLTRYLTGTPIVEKHNQDALIDKAITNLGAFSAIGFLDDMKSFESDLSALMQRNITIGRSRSAVVEKPQISDAAVEKLKAMCAGDITIYKAAKAIKA